VKIIIVERASELCAMISLKKAVIQMVAKGTDI